MHGRESGDALHSNLSNWVQEGFSSSIPPSFLSLFFLMLLLVNRRE